MIRDGSPSDLPRPSNEGWPPTPNPIYVTALAHAWYDQAVAEGLDNPKVLPELPYRASDTSTRCNRALHYKLSDTPKSNPPTIADIWRFRTGHFIHDGVQEFIPRIAPNIRAEVEVDLRSIGIPGSGHCDAATFICREHKAMMLPVDTQSVDVICSHCDGYATLAEGTAQLADEEPGDPCPDCDATGVIQRVQSRYRCATPVRDGAMCETDWLFVADKHGGSEWDPAVERAEHVLELKSQGGFGFKMMATSFRGPPEGAKYGHILQGALAGAALEADRVCVGYLSLENLSPSLAKGYADNEIARFAAEWWYDMFDLRDIVERERARIERLLRFSGTDLLPARELEDPDYPIGAVVTDPAPPRGNAPWVVRHGETIVSMGDTWMCGYCDFRDKCVSDGPS